ncbi:MAG: helix-turn-helix domain-containing protein [Bacteroidia bacterium]|nr:helix-turn-helix domain-containing protein [Bacteroidia bacterium]
MATQKRGILRFRNHNIFIDTHEIEIQGRIHKLSPKEMEVLVMLVKNSDKTLTRKEILEQVWGDEFGNDLGITQIVSKLRQLLGDKEKTIIRTIPKKGYLLSAEKVKVKKSFRPSPLALALLVVGLLISGFIIYKPVSVRIQLAKAAEEKSVVENDAKEEPKVIKRKRIRVLKSAE